MVISSYPELLFFYALPPATTESHYCSIRLEESYTFWYDASDYIVPTFWAQPVRSSADKEQRIEGTRIGNGSTSALLR